MGWAEAFFVSGGMPGKIGIGTSITKRLRTGNSASMLLL